MPIVTNALIDQAISDRERVAFLEERLGALRSYLELPKFRVYDRDTGERLNPSRSETEITSVQVRDVLERLPY